MRRHWGIPLGIMISLGSAITVQAQASDCLWPPPAQFLGNRLSAPDSTLVEMGLELAKVCYSRPSARGRIIFGELVPYGRVWRTGADEPTMLYPSISASVAGVELDAGRYSLLTVPAEEEWIIVLNPSDGTTPAEKFGGLGEVGRGVVGVEHLDDHVERFTIRGRKDAREAELMLEWERTRLRVPIVPRRPATNPTGRMEEFQEGEYGEARHRRQGTKGGRTMLVHVIQTGRNLGNETVVRHMKCTCNLRRWKPYGFPVYVFMVEHHEGTFAIDTGLSSRYRRLASPQDPTYSVAWGHSPASGSSPARLEPERPSLLVGYSASG